MGTRGTGFLSDPGPPFPLSGPQFPFEKKKVLDGAVQEQVYVCAKSCVSVPFALQPAVPEPRGW